MIFLPMFPVVVFTSLPILMGSVSSYSHTSSAVTASAGCYFAVADRADAISPVEADTTQLLLTDDALKHLMVFQQFLLQEQDVLIPYAQSHQVVLRVPTERPLAANGRHFIGKGAATFTVFDIDALTKRFPIVVEAFTHTHLTPKQWREYRRSLVIAVLLDHFFPTDQPPPDLAKSIAWRNVQFYRIHQQAVEAMVADGYWLPFHED